jgi:hypothetical protein
MDETVWHKWEIWGWPRRGIDGRWLFWRVWRRKTEAGWEYQHREETYEVAEWRQW